MSKMSEKQRYYSRNYNSKNSSKHGTYGFHLPVCYKCERDNRDNDNRGSCRNKRRSSDIHERNIQKYYRSKGKYKRKN